MKKKPIYIDTDIGLGTPGAEIDDGAALITLMRSNNIHIAGIGSVFGNVPLIDAAINLDRMMSIMGYSNIPIGIGAEGPLVENMDWFKEWQQGYVSTLPWKMKKPRESSKDLIIRLIKESAEPLTILSIGPMTNLAEAISKESAIQEKVQEVVVMGGSFSTKEAEPEFNLRCDPEAADLVMNAGWPVVAFGLEITTKVHFAREMFHTLESCNPAVQLLKNSADPWIDRVEKMGWEKGGCSLHDAVAAAYLVEPSLFRFISADGIQVNLRSDQKKGSTKIKQTGVGTSGIKIATEVDVTKCRDLIWSLVKQ